MTNELENILAKYRKKGGNIIVLLQDTQEAFGFIPKEAVRYFSEELGIDSLTGMEVMLAIDKKFKTDIPEEEFAKIKNVDDIVEIVLVHLPK